MKRKTLVFLKLFCFVNDREYMKIIYKNCSLRNEYESDFHSNLHYLPVVKIRYEKNSVLYRIWTHDLCCTGSVLYQLSQSKGLRFDSSKGLRIFSLSHVHDKMKKHIFLYLFTELKIYHIS